MIMTGVAVREPVRHENRALSVHQCGLGVTEAAVENVMEGDHLC